MVVNNVLRLYPRAHARRQGAGWAVFLDDDDRVFAIGETEIEAWAAAIDRLRELGEDS